LKFRDISEYNIKTALKEIDEKEYLDTIHAIASKRNALLKETDFYKRKKKLTDYLIRLGYEFDLIFSTVKNVVEKK